jgi:hypothetical protein
MTLSVLAPAYRGLVDRATSHVPLVRCASCSSPLVRPCSWRERPGGSVQLVVTCGECCRETSGEYGPIAVAEFDRALNEARLELGALYTALVRENMEEEARRLARALELDLICADDFAGYNRAAPRTSAGAPE